MAPEEIRFRLQANGGSDRNFADAPRPVRRIKRSGGGEKRKHARRILHGNPEGGRQERHPGMKNRVNARGLLRVTSAR